MKNSKADKNPQISQNEKKKKRKILLGTLILLAVLPLLVVAIGLIGFSIYSRGVEVNASLLPTATAVPTFYDRFSNKLSYAEDGFLSPDEITDNLKYAFISTEDKRFYSHKGYDIVRIGGAILSDIKAGKAKEGASTITQQLVKNTHLSHERTIERKIKEIALATKLEKQYSKDEILSMYLSVIYFGNGIYGAKQAAKFYFAKDIKDLSVAECATLAAIVKNPSKYSPNRDKDASISRRNLVIDKMCEQNYINLDAANIEKSKEIVLAQNDDVGLDEQLTEKDQKIYFDNVIQEVCSALNITKYQLFNSGYQIYTNYDAKIQKTLTSETAKEDEVDKIAIVLSNDGAVLAYASTLGFNPKRQIGSTIKPILYSTAFDQSILTLATPIVDEPIDYAGYSPKNFNDKYFGLTTVNDAIKKSMNSVAVKTVDYVGIDAFFDKVKEFGLSVDEADRNYALSLGATADGISPLELADAYSALANDGAYGKGGFVRFVVDDSKKIYSNENSKEQIIKKSTAQLVTKALVDTVKDGTAKTLSTLPFEIAAKTGTVERDDAKNSDAWCVSYNPDYTVLVWHGSDVGMDEKGGGLPTMSAKTIWQVLYELREKQAYENTFKSEFENDELKLADIDLYSTFRNQKITLATQNIPLEYRKQQYFANDYDGFSTESCFENIEDVEMSIKSDRRGVEIEFESEKIYEYDLYRTDLFGTRLIKHVDSESVDLADPNNIYDAKTSVKLTDNPWSFGRAVNYTLVVYLKNDPNIKNVSTKTVFVDTWF